jgi:hypothetical protein
MYRRKLPPLILRLLVGVFGSVAKIFIRLFERLGIIGRVSNVMMARVLRRLAANNPLRNYTPTAHDVFVATYVKSGTNWMMQIAHQLLFHGNAEFEHIHCVVPWPDTAIMGPALHRYAIPLDDSSVWRASPEQKRVIKTHFNWDLLPYSKDARYILVIRDPKDVFVSSYFFFLKHGVLGEIGISVDTWLRLFLSERAPIWGSWVLNAAGYWAERHRPNVMVVSFKAMKRDLGRTVEEVARFLDMRVSGEVIDRVCEKSSFDYMKRIDDKFRMWKVVPWIDVGPMIRKGKQGASSELLTAQQQRQIDEYFMAELKRLGSDFPYGEFCDITPGVGKDTEARSANLIS